MGAAASASQTPRGTGRGSARKARPQTNRGHRSRGRRSKSRSPSKRGRSKSPRKGGRQSSRSPRKAPPSAVDKSAQLARQRKMLEEMEIEDEELDRAFHDMTEAWRVTKVADRHMMTPDDEDSSDFIPTETKEYLRRKEMPSISRAWIDDTVFVSEVPDTVLNTNGKDGAIQVSNFRRVGNSNVFACGQPDEYGVGTIIQHILSAGYLKVMWVCLREEPHVYINQHPYGTRESDDYLLSKIEYLFKVESEDVEAAEMNIVSELRGMGELETLHITPEKTFTHRTEYITGSNVKTSKEVISDTYGTSVGVPVSYMRLPVTDDNAPEPGDIDQLTELFKNTSRDEGLVFHCHNGKGRSSFAAACSQLYKKALTKRGRRSVKIPNLSLPDLENGEYAAITILCESIDEGYLVKMEVDEVIKSINNPVDLCSCIFKAQAMAETPFNDGKSVQRSGAFWHRKALMYLERYWHLIAYYAYLRGTNGGDDQSFSEWLSSQPALVRQLRNLNLDSARPEAVLTKAQHEAALQGRLHDRVLKFENYRHNMRFDQILEGVSNFRKAPGYPVFGLAQCGENEMNSVTNYLLEKGGYKEILWINVREDSVVFIQGKAHTVRDNKASLELLPTALSRLDEYSGELLERIEENLCKDIVDVANAKPSRPCIGTYVQREDGSYQVAEIDVSQYRHVKSTSTILANQGMPISYARIPLQQTVAPEERAFGDIANLVMSLGSKACVVFSCDNGIERTTLGMVLAAMVLRRRSGTHGTFKHSAPVYDIVATLIESAPNGVDAKNEVDHIIDSCDHVLNLRRDIEDSKKKAHTLLKTRNKRELSRYWHRRGLNALERYKKLLTFNLYLREQIDEANDDATLTTAFSTWVEGGQQSDSDRLYKKRSLF